MSTATLYENVTARILAELEKGALPWVKPWREIPGGHIPANLATGSRYSGCNVFLLWTTAQARGWDDLRFCTYKQAESIDAHVKEGERSTQIYDYDHAQAAAGLIYRRQKANNASASQPCRKAD